MAKYYKGIVGPFYGKVGTVIGSRWRGVDYMRSKPRKRKKSVPTPAQKEQRARFAVAMKFCSPMLEVLNFGFKNVSELMTPQNFAISYLMKSSIVGSYPRFKLDHSSVIISQGKLPNVKNPSAKITGDTLSVDWLDNSDQGIAKGKDPVLIAVYHKQSGSCHFELGNVPRSAKHAEINIAEFGGKSVHVWISTLARMGKETSNSIYLGNLSGRQPKVKT